MGPKHTSELWVYISTPLPNPSGNTSKYVVLHIMAISFLISQHILQIYTQNFIISLNILSIMLNIKIQIYKKKKVEYLT